MALVMVWRFGCQANGADEYMGGAVAVGYQANAGGDMGGMVEGGVAVGENGQWVFEWCRDWA